MQLLNRVNFKSWISFCGLGSQLLKFSFLLVFLRGDRQRLLDDRFLGRFRGGLGWRLGRDLELAVLRLQRVRVLVSLDDADGFP